MAVAISLRFPHHSQMNNIFESNHPLVQHKLSLLRDKNTDRRDFRTLVKEITMMMVYESCRNLSIEHYEIETPIEKMSAPRLAEPSPVLVPILRAGLGMVDGFLELLPTARIGHVGVYRDEETKQPHPYYAKFPPNSLQTLHVICDPMLATGGTINYVISLLKDRGVKQIQVLSLLAAPEGLQEVTSAHPDVNIFVAGIDRALNENCYIVPGLGDAGDRLFGTQ